jgi:5-hydroxyisourate hydrolase-like protein (transthyretin family)
MVDEAARRQTGPVSKMSVSIRVTDCIYGRPAAGLYASLSQELGGKAVKQWRDQTDEDGRISGLTKPPLALGSYILEIDLESYFRALGYESLNSAVSVRFRVINENGHYGLSVFITPAGCMTLREDLGRTGVLPSAGVAADAEFVPADGRGFENDRKP